MATLTTCDGCGELQGDARFWTLQREALGSYLHFCGAQCLRKWVRALILGASE